MAFPGRPLLFESLDEVFARRWIASPKTDGRSIAEGANIRQQNRGLSPNTLMSRRGDRST
jgi:hypothetical protein